LWRHENKSDEEATDEDASDEANIGDEVSKAKKSSYSPNAIFKRQMNVSRRDSHTKLANLEKELKRRSKLIDRELKRNDKIFKSTIKLLLLGTGESGKSTILKQMRIIHASKFTYKEKLETIYDIKSNIRDSILSILEAMERFDIKLENAKLNEAREYVYENIHLFTLNNISTVISDQNNNHLKPNRMLATSTPGAANPTAKTYQSTTTLNPHNNTNHNAHQTNSCAALNNPNSSNSNNSFRNECGCESQEELNEKLARLWQSIGALWADGGTKRCAKRGNEFHLIDSAEYFLDRLSVIKQTDYLPDEQDILRFVNV
jgi:hypothetical protein